MRHKTIIRYQQETNRFKTVHAGRRSFKTEIAKRKVALESFWNEKRRFFFGAPTREQAKRICWTDIKNLVSEMDMMKSFSDSELWVKTKTDSEIWVVGFDKPERFEGTQWHGGVLDEFGNMKESTWNENVMPALRDTKGWAWLIGVPEGKNHYYELSQYARTANDPEWADYCWFSSDVMDENEIRKEKARLDERTFRQEYEGSFESFEGRAYVYYLDSTHRKPVHLDFSRAVCVSCDFNLDPCLWIIGQDHDGHIKAIGEIKQRQTDVWKMCNALKERLGAMLGDRCRKHAIRIYGDYEHGKTRSVSAVASSWQIIRDEFAGWNVEFKLKSHPRIVDRINAVNSKLRAADGSVRLTIDPECVDLHKDFDQVSLEDLQGTKPTGDRTHASDCLGYWINFEYPVVKIQGVQY